MVPWEMVWPIGIVILGLAIGYGAWRNAHRNKANDAITEEATRQEYDHPDTYMEGRKQALDREVRPS